jgi:hypothetical protein
MNIIWWRLTQRQTKTLFTNHYHNTLYSVYSDLVTSKVSNLDTLVSLFEEKAYFSLDDDDDGDNDEKQK